MKSVRKEVWRHLSLLLASGAIGFAAYAVQQPVSRSAPAVAAAAPQLSCSGGADGELDLDLDAALVTSVGGRERATLSATVLHRLAGDARIKYSLELVDDRGRYQQAPSVSSIHRGQKSQAQLVDALEVAGLADGFYQARLTAAARREAGSDSAAASRSFYFRIQGGALVPMDVNEWLARSAYARPQVN